MLILLYFCRAATMLLNAAGESRVDGDNDGLGRKKNCAEGHNRKACGTRGRFYRGSEMERGRLVHTAREPSTLLMLKRSLTGEVFCPWWRVISNWISRPCSGDSWGGGNPVLKIIFEIQPRIVSSGVGFCFLPEIWRHSAQTGTGINRAYVGEYFQLQIKTHLVPCSL